MVEGEDGFLVMTAEYKAEMQRRIEAKQAEILPRVIARYDEMRLRALLGARPAAANSNAGNYNETRVAV